MKKKVLYPLFLAALAVPLCLSSKSHGVSASFIGDYNDKTDYLAYGVEVNAQLADEGFVLLKNDGTLPLDEGAQITVSVQLKVHQALRLLFFHCQAPRTDPLH